MKPTTDFLRAVHMQEGNQPLVRFWRPSKTISQRLKVFVARQQEEDYYTKIGFPDKIEFHWMPTWQDWKQALSKPVRWFLFL